MSESRSNKQIGIIGGGISGLALALALQKLNIKSVVFEIDSSVDSRHQGYALTMQQGGEAIKKLGIVDKIAANCVWSRSHFIFNANGDLVVFWGIAASLKNPVEWNGSFNVQISRQNLRLFLLQELDDRFCQVQWGSSIKGVTETTNGNVKISLDSNIEEEFDIVVGCDGIFSKLRQWCYPETPLKYLGVIVILGIANEVNLFSQRVVQMSNGKTRIYIMPYDKGRTMWQLSFFMDLNDATLLSKNGGESLKKEALERCKDFKGPLIDFLESTTVDLITGYPIYDRDPVLSDPSISNITVIGDAAHCMSPFKGQGANQALLDAVMLADIIHENKSLRLHEELMMKRSSKKVIGSRKAIFALHCPEFIDIEYQLSRKGYQDGYLERFNRIRAKFNIENVCDVDISVLNEMLEGPVDEIP